MSLAPQVYKINAMVNIAVPVSTEFTVNLSVVNKTVALTRYDFKILQAALSEAWIVAERQEWQAITAVGIAK